MSALSSARSSARSAFVASRSNSASRQASSDRHGVQASTVAASRSAFQVRGKRTASGERFDQAKPLAAHPELPLGSETTVVNPDTGARVEVEVVDRGSYAKGRDLDLSEAAAERLGVLPEVRSEGDTAVRIEATEG